jgi:hypothetical protein
LILRVRVDRERSHLETQDGGLRKAVSLFLGVVGAGIGLVVATSALDIGLTSVTPESWIEAFVTQGVAASLGSLAEVLAAVFGIALTVVAIVVQLAAQRYPAKIVDVFMVDRVNILTFAFMAASCIYVVLVPSVATTEPAGAFASGLALVLTVGNFGLLLPYFGHVFAFLEPTNLISEIERRARAELAAARGTSTPKVGRHQRNVALSIDRVADNCMAAVAAEDRNLALHSVRTIESFLVHYQRTKEQMPEAWSHVEWDIFGTLAAEFVDEIVETGTWLEAKGMMEFERVLRSALTRANEVVSQIAKSTGTLGSEALRRGDRETVSLTIRFFNTYIRHGLNQRNVRAVYNILYEYRRFAAEVLTREPELATRIVEHLVYYGRLANDMGLPFVTVTVAHDVRVLCQLGHADAGFDIGRSLSLFLTLDQPSEAKSEEVALIGVRKAQSILGAYLLDQDAADLADAIRKDMRHEETRRLEVIRDEILAVSERKFWEITDRGMNFDWVAPELRPQIRRFFEPLLD